MCVCVCVCVCVRFLRASLLFICANLCVSVWVFVCLFVCLFACLFVCSFIRLLVYLSVWPFVCWLVVRALAYECVYGLCVMRLIICVFACVCLSMC